LATKETILLEKLSAWRLRLPIVDLNNKCKCLCYCYDARQKRALFNFISMGLLKSVNLSGTHSSCEIYTDGMITSEEFGKVLFIL
jgi:hypothetical protein